MAATPTPIPSSETSVLRIRKTVSSKKAEANRKNAKQSTGPRTEHGKRNSKFNAVTLGLFAKHVTIPICDGYKPERDFQALLDALHHEFQPLGVYEEWLVVKIAECMWRLRRATRCESGSVRESELWRNRREHTDQTMRWRRELDIVIRAEKQLRDSGTLAQEIYDQIQSHLAPQTQSEKVHKIETEHERVLFLAFIEDRKQFLEMICNGSSKIEGDMHDARSDHEVLLPADDMDRILRYEERTYRQLDWAVQRLLERQERRRTVEPARLR